MEIPKNPQPTSIEATRIRIPQSFKEILWTNVQTVSNNAGLGLRQSETINWPIPDMCTASFTCHLHSVSGVRMDSSTTLCGFSGLLKKTYSYKVRIHITLPLFFYCSSLVFFYWKK